jgi:mannose-1-phosphate guanylyltransferase
MAISYKNEQFLEYLGDGSEFGVEIIHAIEDEPLGTGGAIRNASQFLHSSPQDSIAILNGDILSAHDMKAQVVLHKNVGADATLHLIHVADARPYGSVPTEESGKIIDFVEKSDDPPTNFINAGCYIFTRSAVDAIPAGEVVSIERETFPGLLTAGRKLWAYKSESYWIDIGTPAALFKGSRDLVNGAFAAGEGTTFGTGSLATGGSCIGANCEIGQGVTIDNSIIGDGVKIGDGAQIRDSFILHDSAVQAGAQVVSKYLSPTENLEISPT